jgi:hypothetical protein
MKRDGLARVSKIDVGALLDKNKSFAQGAILFPAFEVGGYHWAIFAFWFLRSEKEAARLLQIRMGQVPVPRRTQGQSEITRPPRASAGAGNEFRIGSPRRGRPLASNDSALSIRELKA